MPRLSATAHGTSPLPPKEIPGTCAQLRAHVLRHGRLEAGGDSAMQGAGGGGDMGGSQMRRSRCDVCGRRPSWWVSLIFSVPVAPVGLDGVALCDECVIDGVPIGWTVAPYTPAEAS